MSGHESLCPFDIKDLYSNIVFLGRAANAFCYQFLDLLSIQWPNLQYPVKCNQSEGGALACTAHWPTVHCVQSRLFVCLYRLFVCLFVCLIPVKEDHQCTTLHCSLAHRPLCTEPTFSHRIPFCLRIFFSQDTFFLLDNFFLTG